MQAIYVIASQIIAGCFPIVSQASAKREESLI